MSMKNHRDFTQWVISQGVEINGIAAHKFPGRGLGIVAKRNHEAGKVLLNVPASCLRTVDTISHGIARTIEDGPVHGRLALSQCLDTHPLRASWRRVMPTMEDFRESMPFLWHESLQEFLPLASKNLLENQQRKYKADWMTSLKAFSDLDENTYIYNWLLVNTRTFYWVSPGMKKPSNRDDCMALAPFADYFNHADSGCEVNFGDSGITITADRTFQEGEEIFISYGPHSNDFLLTEYGFILAENKWDEIHLDRVILPNLSVKQKKQLEELNFLGNYVLDRETICYRTQVALRILCVPLKKWRSFVSGEDNGEKDQEKVDEFLLKLLRRYLKHAEESIDSICSSSTGSDHQRKLLVLRWKQIFDLLSITINRIQVS